MADGKRTTRPISFAAVGRLPSNIRSLNDSAVELLTDLTVFNLELAINSIDHRRFGMASRMEVKMKRVAFAFVALAAMTATAVAADMARRAPYYPAPVPAYAPIFNWTGFYIGINGGGGFGSSNWDSTGSRDVSGGLHCGAARLNFHSRQRWGRARGGD